MVSSFIGKLKGMFKTNKEDVEVGDIISFKNKRGITEYARVTKIEGLTVWAGNWVTDINEVDNKCSDKRVNPTIEWDENLSKDDIKEVFKGKSKKSKLSPIQVKFLSNKRKMITEEINSKEDYKSCFKDVRKEVDSWSNDVILNWKIER